MRNIAVALMKANKKRKRAIKKAEQKMLKQQKERDKLDKAFDKKYRKDGPVITQPKEKKSIWDDSRTETLYKSLLYNDKDLKKHEVNQIKNTVNDLDNKRKVYKEYYNSLKEMNNSGSSIEIVSKRVKEKDISRLSVKEQKRALARIKKQFQDKKYGVVEKDGFIYVEKVYTDKKKPKLVKTENKKVLEDAKKHLDNLNEQYKEAKQFKTDVNKTLKDKAELEEKLIKERLAKQTEIKQKQEDKTKKLLESLNYEFDIIDENTIQRDKAFFDPEKLRNIKTKENVSIKQLMKEQEFIDNYNAEMEEIDWDNHKISYLELNKIMENHKYKDYNQIERPKEYQKKVRTRAVNNVLKSLKSAGLATTDFYAFVEQNLNLSNIDAVIANLNDGEIFDLFASDQTTTANSIKKFIQGFKVDLDKEFRGRTLAEIVEEAEQKI